MGRRFFLQRERVFKVSLPGFQQLLFTFIRSDSRFNDKLRIKSWQKPFAGLSFVLEFQQDGTPQGINVNIGLTKEFNFCLTPLGGFGILLTQVVVGFLGNLIGLDSSWFLCS